MASHFTHYGLLISCRFCLSAFSSDCICFTCVLHCFIRFFRFSSSAPLAECLRIWQTWNSVCSFQLSFQVWTSQIQETLNCKKLGDAAFRAKDFATAIKRYTQVNNFWMHPNLRPWLPPCRCSLFIIQQLLPMSVLLRGSDEFKPCFYLSCAFILTPKNKKNWSSLKLPIAKE